VWTAAHCLQEFGGDLFFDIMFVPAHDNRYPGPPVFGTFVGGPIYTTLGWQLGAQIQALRGEDYGGLIVSRNESGQTLSEAIGVQNAATLMGPDPAKGIAPVNEDARAYIYGYPGTDPNALNYCASRPIVSGDQIVPVNYARCRMREGASGGGWFQYEFDEDTCLVWGRLVGVTSYDVNATLMGSSWITPVAVALYLIAETYLPDEDDFPDPPQDPVSAPSSSPEQPAVEPSQVCPVPAPSEVYVPSVRTGSNPFGSSMDTGLQIFNSSGSATSAELRYVREDGSTLPTENITVPANGSITITKYRDQATGLRLPENFTGSAYIASTGAGKGLSAAVNHIVNNRALASSSAATLENGRSRPATEPSKEVRLPLLMNDNYGTSTWYTVQNTTASEITVTALYSYTKSDGTPGFETAVLEPYASVTFDQRTLAGAPKVLSGVIQASGPVAAVVFQQTGGEQLTSYSGFGEAAAGPAPSAPLIMANNWGSFTGVQVQNAGSEPTQITLTYGRDTSGDKTADGKDPVYGPQAPKKSCGTPGPTSTDPDPAKYIKPGESVTFLQRVPIPARDGNPPIPGNPFFDGCAYIGSAVASSSNGQPLVLVVNQVWPDWFASTYEGRAHLGPVAELPLVQSGNFGTNGGVQIQNAGSATKVRITFNANTAKRNDPPGSLPPCPDFPSSRTIDMGPQSSQTYVLPDHWSELKYDPGDDPGVGCRYIGSVTATAINADGSVNQNGKVSGIVNQTSGNLKDLMGTYSAG
jgi:hypothetical protein